MLKPILQNEFKMKIVKDLGMKKPTPNYYKKVRMATFECTCCNQLFDAVVSTKAKNQLFCKTCNGKQLSKPNRNHPLYRVWADTKTKLTCTDKRSISYLSKHITMCQEWEESYDTFFAWSISAGWKQGLSIDRIDNNLSYTPSNCRWVDASVQAANTRRLKSTNATGYRGVHKTTKSKYVANARFRFQRFGLGSYDTAEQAALAYDCFIRIMQWPNTTNGLYATGMFIHISNSSTSKFLNNLFTGIQYSNILSKRP